MRAPPESFSPTTGAPPRMAKSMILHIFEALASESEPPKTVKSCAKTYTSRPSTRPYPVTKPSPGGRCCSMPKSVHWWVTNLSSSSNVPSSSSSAIRSRAESFPAACSRDRRSTPPPASAASLRRRNSAISLRGVSWLDIGTPRGRRGILPYAAFLERSGMQEIEQPVGAVLSRWRANLGALQVSVQPRPIIGQQDGVAGVGRVILDAGRLAGNEPVETRARFEARDVLRRFVAHTGDRIAVAHQFAVAVGRGIFFSSP